MKENIELDLAWSFVTKTNRNIFLTGKAGTGKTTFLHKLKKECRKRLIVVAPTGVAAINAKGVTIHSFFQMPFGPILPNEDLQTASKFSRKFSKTKINIIKSLDLLIIDEISMVRADLLDGIDKVLRRFKNRQLPFGGTQLLMIGDLQQLSPVVKEHEWQLLKSYYKNYFFFSSLAYEQCRAITIELKHIYRQENPVFIAILNGIRNNQLSQQSADELNKRYQPDFSPKEGYISLTTHNRKAAQINQKKLDELEGETQTYQAILAGDFPEHAFPNKDDLQLKIGAQVMFIKNDSAAEKRYFNGKIGKVIALSEDEVVVRCPQDDFNITTSFETWENIKYTVNNATKEITEDKIGSYSQIPLRLAWSITIHKSQGLTFEKAIIDAEDAFAHGQTYVALSRCKSLEGLVLKSKISPQQIITDSHVVSFNKTAENNQPNEGILQESKRQFQLDLISEVFNFYEFLHPTNRTLDIYYKNRNSIEGKLEEPLKRIKNLVTHLLKISNSFNLQLQTVVGKTEIPETSNALQDRFVKAISYFNEQTKSGIETAINAISFTTDNKTVDKDIVKQLDALEELLAAKLFYFEGLKNEFHTDAFLKLRAESVFLLNVQPKKQRKTVVEGTSNTKLFELLKALRSQIATRENVAHFQIFTQKSLYAMCELLPTTKQELKAVHGMGKKRIETYGAEILEVISEYINDNNVVVQNNFNSESKHPKRKKGDSQKASLQLFKQGKTIAQIADERELNTNTIFGHLASFIPSGEIEITDLMTKTNYKELKKVIPTKTFDNLSDLKHQLDEKFSYGEIRLVLNELEKLSG
ncbi:helicase [Mangrovimonas yunxiaonensis]|uniref:Helicase n=1 Tax=Mangrovimonas yunxiaonensis TaxID=1197477 RepID=A0A084TKZ2_9FLAO|nr:helix-turn-helix domain-containing protein [Mangrovimonas yunxiaonensis]KFB01378.1 helicase [Mangrovimonas yunxiaonensis]GGH37033.1 helicase [Mangrovimonas yunxiaonensis]